MRRLSWLFFLAAPAVLLGQTSREQPVALLVRAEGASIVRAASQLPLTAYPGDILFAGDVLLTESGTATFLYCPEKVSLSLASGGDVLFEANRWRVRQGSLTAKQPAAYCTLPPVEKAPSASRRHDRDVLTRALQPASPEGFPARLQALPEAQRNALQAELAPVDQALSRNADDGAARLARATLLSRYGLSADAAAEYGRLGEAWTNAEWLRRLVHEEISAQAAKETPVSGEGKTYALVIGISRYQRLIEDQQLRFAHADAELFEKYLRSPRGGGLGDSELLVLTNQKATTAAIRTAIETFLKVKVGKKDTLILFIAAHGTVVESGGRSAGYIVTHDSDPQDLAATALPMEDVQELMRRQLPKVGRMLIYVDVCRAGIIGTIRSNAVNDNVSTLLEEKGDLLGLLASRGHEYSREGPRWGGGHGAFSYFLLRGLNGDADKQGNGDGMVTAEEVIDYVRQQVRKSTQNKQTPTEKVSFAVDLDLVDTRKEGITVAELTDAADEGPVRFLPGLPRPPTGEEAAPAPRRSGATDDLQQFEEALAAGRILPETPDSAFEALQRLQRRLPREEYLVLEDRLRVAIEDRGQQALLRYLAGDQIPQSRDQFASGAVYFQAGQVLTPQSPLLQSREAFCRGRVLIFDKQYPRATAQLEHALRLEPNGAYSYNALGIAYLEQANYTRAVQGFRDAARLAPYWAYPLHNLALAYSEVGDYEAAIRTYEHAMRLAPQYSYLPYNLGLLYQRLNRRREAETQYRKALALTPDLAEPHNALGFLYASAGKTNEAERSYRLALDKNPELLAARHNLAVLFASQRQRSAEAISLWQENLVRAKEYLPSRISLAEALAGLDRVPEAVEEYKAVVGLRPDYVAARIALAQLLVRARQPDAALEQLREALQRKPGNAAAYEQIGDIETSGGHPVEARTAYRAALERTVEPKVRKRLQRKLSEPATR